MKRVLTFVAMTLALFTAVSPLSAKKRKTAPEPADFTLSNAKITVTIDRDGRLTCLKNNATGQDYAGKAGLWRLYYDTLTDQEIEVTGAEQKPQVRLQDGKIVLHYDAVTPGVRGRVSDSQTGAGEDGKVPFALTLTVSLEENWVRFGATLANNAPHTVVRELQYPLVGDLDLPEDHKLLTTYAGGHVYDHVKEKIAEEGLGGLSGAYMTPAQYFRQLEIMYPQRRISANCFALISKTQGLYFGSHDGTFQNTWHGLRVYPSAPERFDRLECGFYKYPNCLYGKTWTCDANVVAPYCGEWTETSRLYRSWVNATWWDRKEPPMWVRTMRSWQRVIFKHQYGQYFFKYSDLPGRMLDVERSVGSDAVLIFGWWKAGMDHGNPDYVPDEAQGGEAGFKDAIRRYREAGGHPLLYFNGKLIDVESDYYKSGKAAAVTMKDNAGRECIEHYKFTGHGSFMGKYNYRSFVVADTRKPQWLDLMQSWADYAWQLGCSSVFYDQMGTIEKEAVNWDRSGEFAVPEINVIRDKAAALKRMRDYVRSRYPDFAIGAEHITDITSMYLDYNHGEGYVDFIDWFRYTFPELILSDRRLRDDTDVERRVNHTILKGLRNDIEIYRCRDLIDKTPRYQAYLSKVNAIKARYADPLMLGRFAWHDAFDIDNDLVEARCFIGTDKMAIVATQEQKTPQTLTASLKVRPEWKYKECVTLGDASVSPAGDGVTLGQYGLAVLIYGK